MSLSSIDAKLFPMAGINYTEVQEFSVGFLDPLKSIKSFLSFDSVSTSNAFFTDFCSLFLFDGHF